MATYLILWRGTKPRPAPPHGTGSPPATRGRHGGYPPTLRSGLSYVWKVISEPSKIKKKKKKMSAREDWEKKKKKKNNLLSVSSYSDY